MTISSYIDKDGNFLKVNVNQNKVICHKKLEGTFHYMNSIESFKTYLITSSLEGYIYVISEKPKFQI
jgi:hypothetical protein